MAKTDGPVDVSAELAALKHERQNQKMKRLLPNTTVQRRPLHHAPVASALAGSSVQKVVYVSSRTPVMAAVKRVKKLLFEIEKRAVQSADAKGTKSSGGVESVAEAIDRLAKMNEEVLVKASGRAMQQALRVGEWFRNKEKEMICKVEVRTGSAQAVDDIVETEMDVGGSWEEDEREGAKDDPSGTSTLLEGGETTLELLGNTTTSSVQQSTNLDTDKLEEPEQVAKQDINAQKKRKRIRTKRATYNADDVPEARIRWVKTVEVAISLRT